MGHICQWLYSCNINCNWSNSWNGLGMTCFFTTLLLRVASGRKRVVGLKSWQKLASGHICNSLIGQDLWEGGGSEEVEQLGVYVVSVWSIWLSGLVKWWANCCSEFHLHYTCWPGSCTSSGQSGKTCFVYLSDLALGMSWNFPLKWSTYSIIVVTPYVQRLLPQQS